MKALRSRQSFVRFAGIALACSAVFAPAATAVAASSSATPAPSATPIYLTPAETTHLHDFLVEYGASESTANRLINRWKSGYAWDSMTGKKPVKTVVQAGDEGEAVQVDTYRDGSVATTTAPGLVVPGSTKVTFVHSDGSGTVGGCSGTSASHYQTVDYGCLVNRDTAAINMRFRADYTLVAGGTHISSIQKVYTLLYAGAGINFNSPTLSIVRANQIPQQQAQAHAQAQITGAVPVGLTGTIYLDFYVGDTHATASANF